MALRYLTSPPHTELINLSQTSSITTKADMPSFRPPYKRRKSGSHHSVSSKRTISGSSTQSISRSSRAGTSRRSSGSSLQGQSRQRVSRDVSERPASSIDARTYTGVATTVADDVSEVPQDEHADLEMLSEVIMAVHLTDHGAIGCAYYVARTETLYFMEDVKMGDVEMVDSCKSAVLFNWRLREANKTQ